MLHLSSRKFFFAEKDGKPVGVFSAVEKAHCAEHDSLTEITPSLLDNSPASEQYVCMAKGTRVMLLREENAFTTAYFNLGPAWGLNPQSAAGGLYGVHNSRKNAFITELYLFEIDRPYTADEVETLHNHPTFRALTQRSDDCDSLTQDQIETDYIARWIDRENKEALYAQRASSAEVCLLTDRLTQAACSGEKSQGGSFRCGFALSRTYSRTHDQIKHRLLSEFEQQELRSLAVLLRLMEPSEEVPFPQNETAAELLERVKKCVDIVSLRNSRRLKDCLD